MSLLSIKNLMQNTFPLTKQQLGLWVEQCLHPSNTSYNTCVKVKLDGVLDIQRFLDATPMVIDYFDTLKVFFTERQGIPYQSIEVNGNYQPEFIDISNGARQETSQNQVAAKAILSKKLNTPIDLRQFPITRACLVKTADKVFYFIGMVPHIVSDGRSAILYLEALSIAYNKGIVGLQTEYQQSKRSWRDYLADERTKFDKTQWQEAQLHWQQRLAKAPHYFDYSYGNNARNRDDHRGERVYFDLSETLSKQLKQHTKQQRTTLFNSLVCVFSIFVHRYYQLEDVLIGYPVNIRPRGYKHFFGFFVNILPIRVDMSGDPSYLTLLKRVHQVRKEDKRYQDYPALDLVADIRNRNPNFDGRVFNLSMAQTVSRLFNLELNGIETEPLDTEYSDVNDDFSLSYELIENRIGLWFEYRKALFEPAFIEQAMQHIESIIRQILTQPEIPISQFELLSKQQQSLKLQQAIDSSQRFSTSNRISSVVELFELQAAKSAEQVALVDGGRRYTYQQINAKSNQLARKIISLVGNKGCAIALEFERSAALIIAQLAVLKSGCYYVPLAKSYPLQRKISIVKQSKAKLKIYDGKQQEAFSSAAVEQKSSCADLLYIDWHNKTGANSFQEQNLEIEIRDKSLAYVIYTSGSTGDPKGVMLTHKNLASRLNWLKSYFNLDAEDAMLQHTDYSFDVSLAEIFLPIISGARLVIADQKKGRDPNYLLSLIDTHKVTISCLVPSLLRLLISHDRQQKLITMRHFVAAGEILPNALKKQFYQIESTNNAQLYNFYGPTEACIYASFCKVFNDDLVVTIGKALGGTLLLVLDPNQVILPTGVAGELYIGGAGLAKGYLRQPQLSKKHFIDYTFDGGEPIQLYATGDRARVNFEGDIEYLGRLDRQVKIRGFRVELGEIENVISQQSEVKDVALISQSFKGDIPNFESQRLVAYIQPNIENKIKTQYDEACLIQTLKKQLLLKLPDYMLPTFYLVVDLIPRLASGKVATNLLPEAKVSSIKTIDFIPAQSQEEKQLAAIWSRILSLPPAEISVNSHFFELGGDSLMAIQFVSLAEAEGLYFDMNDLFDSPTIASLVGRIRSQKQQQESTQVIAGAYPLLPRQIKFFKDAFINSNHWNRTFSFDVKQPLQVQALRQGLLALLQQHDNLRVRFEQSASQQWQQVCVELAQIDIDSLLVVKNLKTYAVSKQQQIMQHSVTQMHHAIRLNQSPLMRMGYFETGQQCGHLVVIFHHLLLDMVSSRIIFEDLLAAYQASLYAVRPQLPAKTTSVKQWVEHIGQLAEQNSFEQEVAYWERLPLVPTPNIIANLTVSSETQLINPKSSRYGLEKSAKVVSFELSQDLTKRLLTELPKLTRLPIQNYLIACFYQAINAWCGHSDVSFSTCSHGRESQSSELPLSRSVGWLNSVYPIMLQMNKDTPILQLSNVQYLKAIQQQIEAVPTNKIAYNILRYHKQEPRITQHPNPPLFFNYVGQLDAIIPADAPFVPQADLPGVAGIAGENHLCYLLYIEAGVIQRRLQFRLTYSHSIFEASAINHFIDLMQQSIIQRSTY